MRRRFRPFLALLCAPVFAPAAEPSPETVLLDRVRIHMARMLNNLPNYTCLQTIERSERKNEKKKWSPVDTIRIEVALVNGKELFSWPGEGNFVDTGIGEMVGGGSIGTGSFAMHAKAVFQGRSAEFSYQGASEWRGRKTHLWNFRVPQNRSAFAIRRGEDEAVVGYHGTIRIDAETLDNLRLEVATEEVPEKLQIRSTADAVEYRRVNLSGQSFLLPSLAELVMTSTNGFEARNETKFSGCRQFSGESKLLFDDPPPDLKPNAGPAKVIKAPPGLIVDFTLDGTTRLREAAIGDPLTGTLRRSVTLPDHTTIAKGAKVHGRIVQIRKTNYFRTSALAAAALFYEVDNGSIRLTMDSFLRSVYATGPEVLSRDPGIGLAGPDPKRPGGYIFVRDTSPYLRSGLRMIWQTMEPPRREAPEKEKAGHEARP